MNEMDAAYCAWEDAHPHNIDPYESFVAGWQASKADSHNHKVVVEYDLAPAFIEGNLRDKLIELGWSPPGSGVKYYYEAPDKTCSCGLNPSGCNMGCDV